MMIDKFLSCDVLVAGAGIAGLLCAKQALDQGLSVIIVTNDKFCSGASYFELKASLGIQATAGEQDKILFLEDISNRGKGVENKELIDTYIHEIQENIHLLAEIGFKPWRRSDQRPACFAKYARDIYLISDWQNSKKRANEIFSQYSKLTILEYSNLVHIVKKDDRVSGAIISDGTDFIAISTPVVIGATGGIAGLYKDNLYPTKVRGSGHIVLMEAGATVQNIEFIQFIPAFVKPVYNVLFGEHTLKYCNGLYKDNTEITWDKSKEELKALLLERSSYAPFSFDFESHIIDLAMIDGIDVIFDKSLYDDQEEFYKIYLSWLKDKIGIDMCNDDIRIAPFAHSCNGGIKIDNDAKTGILGLYAVGELSSAIEGANRLGGNSMGASLVFSKRAIQSIKNYLKDYSPSNNFDFIKRDFEKWLAPLLFKKTNEDFSYEEIAQRLENIISTAGNIIRNESVLTKSLAQIDAIKEYFYLRNNVHRGLDIYFRIEMIKMLLLAMLARKESRGGHYRSDYPYTDSNVYKLMINRNKGNFIINKSL